MLKLLLKDKIEYIWYIINKRSKKEKNKNFKKLNHKYWKVIE